MRPLLAVLAFFAISFPAFAQECQGLPPADAVREKWSGVASFEFPAGEVRDNLVAYINAVKPVTDYQPQEVWLFYSEEAAAVVLFIDGCAAIVGPSPPPVVALMLRAAQGE